MFWRYPVDDVTQEWLLEEFQWAIEHGLLSRDTPLILPTKEFFRAGKGTNQEVAFGLVKDIQRLLGIEKQRIEVEELAQLPDEFTHEPGKMTSVAGTWEGGDEASVVRFSANLMGTPLALIATLVHEVMHHVLDPDPEGEDMGFEELHTDAQCITCGFGVIEIKAADQLGWLGYMRQTSRAHALALFLRVREIDESIALEELSGRTAKMLKKALKVVDRDVASLARLRGQLGAR